MCFVVLQISVLVARYNALRWHEFIAEEPAQVTYYQKKKTPKRGCAGVKIPYSNKIPAHGPGEGVAQPKSCPGQPQKDQHHFFAAAPQQVINGCVQGGEENSKDKGGYGQKRNSYRV